MDGLVKWASVSIGIFMLYLTALAMSNGTKQTTDTILPLLQ